MNTGWCRVGAAAPRSILMDQVIMDPRDTPGDDDLI
jgi:hypothetical protein